MHLLWRLLYRLVDSRWAAAALAAAIRLGRRLGDGGPGHRLWGRLGGLRRWPRGTRGWYNLHLSRLRWRVYRRLDPTPRIVRRPVAGLPRRIACVGPFGASLRFTRRLFEAFPSGSDLLIYEVDYPGSPPAEYLATLASSYRRMACQTDSDYPNSLESVARALDTDRPDLLLVVGYGQEAYDLLDRADTPCIAQVCTSSDLLHHPEIDFHLYGQPEADYFIRDNDIFCGTSRAGFGAAPIFEDPRFHDRRGIDAAALPAWTERRPQILFHGSLFKLASPPFLGLLFDLLADDREAELLFAGRDDGRALGRIDELARRRGAAGQVHYLGYLRPPAPGSQAEERSPEWRQLISHLASARLAPDPWPIGGGCARFEAYAAAVPSVHMGVRFDRASWGRAQHALVEVLCLQLPMAAATTPAEYKQLCRRCLYDEAYAAELIRQQLALVARSNDAAAWWRQLEECWRQWQLRATA